MPKWTINVQECRHAVERVEYLSVLTSEWSWDYYDDDPDEDRDWSYYEEVWFVHASNTSAVWSAHVQYSQAYYSEDDWEPLGRTGRCVPMCSFIGEAKDFVGNTVNESIYSGSTDE